MRKASFKLTPMIFVARTSWLQKQQIKHETIARVEKMANIEIWKNLLFPFKIGSSSSGLMLLKFLRER
jgi:hypothetical protein